MKRALQERRRKAQECTNWTPEPGLREGTSPSADGVVIWKNSRITWKRRKWNVSRISSSIDRLLHSTEDRVGQGDASLRRRRELM